MLRIDSPAWKRVVWIQRWTALAMIGASTVMVYLNWRFELHALMAVTAFCCGVNVMLAWINWRVFSV